MTRVSFGVEGRRPTGVLFKQPTRLSGTVHYTEYIYSGFSFLFVRFNYWCVLKMSDWKEHHMDS